jgi:hypothetical protein
LALPQFGAAFYALSQVIEKIECEAAMPLGDHANLLLSLEKETGGTRLAGSLPLLMRIWAKSRKQCSVQWEVANARKHAWSAPGRSL